MCIILTVCLTSALSVLLKYNQFESMIMPLGKISRVTMVCKIEYGIDVKNVIIETVGDKKVAKPDYLRIRR